MAVAHGRACRADSRAAPREPTDIAVGHLEIDVRRLRGTATGDGVFAAYLHQYAPAARRSEQHNWWRDAYSAVPFGALTDPAFATP
jgi:hypothetical protein